MRKPMSKNKFLQSNLFLDGPEEILSIHSLSINQSGFGYQNLIPKIKLQGSVKRKQQQWYLDSACSRHMTGDKRSFLSLKNIKGGNVAFGNGKSGEIQGIGKVGSIDTHAIENVYYVNGLQHNLLSVSQICDKGNNVLFTEKECRVTNSVTGNLVLLGKRHNNVYKTKFVESK